MQTEAAHIRPPTLAGEPGAGFGLYVHWPFCEAKCPYCDFNSHVVARIDQARWAEALAADVKRVARLTADRELTSVFFGGGTPSLMEERTVETIMTAIRAGWRCAPDLEVTLEANPTSVDAARFAGYRAAGVTRLSLGIQALNDLDLKRLGRRHTADEARAAFDTARRTFGRVSFDLICARQDQTLAAWRTELKEAMHMAADHLSLYQLTIEPGTAFADRLERGGLRGLPDEDLGADLYEMTVEHCAAAGLHQYEVSNFARSDAECRHNLLYWSGGEYAGVGPGAHGRLVVNGVRVASEQQAAPGAWLDAARSATHEVLVPLSPEDIAEEYIMMGLRKSQGLDLDCLAALQPATDRFEKRMRDLVALGLLVEDLNRLRVSDRGRLVLDRIVMELTAE